MILKIKKERKVQIMFETIFTVIFLGGYFMTGGFLFLLRKVALAHPNWKTYFGWNYADSVTEWLRMWFIFGGFMLVGYIESH